MLSDKHRVATRPGNRGCPGIVLELICVLENVLELKKMDLMSWKLGNWLFYVLDNCKICFSQNILILIGLRNNLNKE